MGTLGPFPELEPKTAKPDADRRLETPLESKSESGLDGEGRNIQRYIISPKYENSSDECTDIIIYSDDTLVLLEVKARLLTADAKYNGRFHDLERDLKSKFIGTKKDRIGIWQLWTAIQSLANKDEKTRRKVTGVDISGIKRIFPVLVVLEHALSTPWINWYLHQEFQHILKPGSLLGHLEIMPLSVLTISDLENLEPYLTDTLFHNHLDKWIELYRRTDFSTFSIYLASLKKGDLRRNQFMEQQLEQIKADIKEFFSSITISSRIG